MNTNRRGFLHATTSVGALAVLGGTAALTASAFADEKPAPTRGVVLYPFDLSLADWPERCAKAGINTIGMHAARRLDVLRDFIAGADGRSFLSRCEKFGIAVEYELHAMGELLSRELYYKEPALFRMDENGRRNVDANCCPHSAAALDIIAAKAIEWAKIFRPTTHRHFYWPDDGAQWCRCEKCRDFSGSEQALLVENHILRALRTHDAKATLAHICYSHTLAAPVQVKPEPGVFLEFAPIARDYAHPIGEREAKTAGAAPDPLTNGGYLDFLAANLAVFGVEQAQVLEYWLDVSLFSKWTRPAVKLPWKADICRADIAAYRQLGVRHITTFATYIDADYVKLHGARRTFPRGILRQRATHARRRGRQLAELGAPCSEKARFPCAVGTHRFHTTLKSLISIFTSLLLSASVADAEVIHYTLPRAGKVSLAVYDAQGRQVRTLLAGESHAAGKHELNWDGLDRLGKAMPVGAYEWRLLLNDGLEADYVAVVGQTPINAAEPWVWTVGSHQGPSSVVVGAGGTLYHGSRNSEGPPVLMKLGSENGPVLWTRGWQTKGPVDMVEMGGKLFVLGWNAELQRVDAATGRDDGKPLDLLWPGDTRPGCDDAVSSYGIKLGADGDKLVVAYREHGVLRWLEPTTGAVLREVAVSQPRAVVTGEKGAVFVLSGAELVSVAANGAISKIIGAGVLAAPVTFDFDRARREFFVGEGRADQRVRRFALDGKSLGDFGRLGGRADGAYVATDFRDVSHLRCDGAGGFYAVESDHLRRIVHVNEQGAVVKEWLGGSPFFSVTSVDASAPGELWYEASYTTMAMVALDLESGAVRVTHTYSMPESGFADGLFPAIGEFPVWRVRRHAGGTYLIHESPAALLRVDAGAGKLVPVALASHKRWDAKNFKNAAINAAMGKAALTYDDIGSDAFTWSDTNGNGELDADEFRFHNSAALMHGRYCAFDENLNVFIGFQGAKNYCYTGKRWMLFDFKGSAYAKLPNLAAAGAATPVWDWSKLELSRAMLPDDLRGTEGGAVATRHDARGGVTLAVRGEIGALTDRHGLTWPEDTIGTSCLLRALPDGTAWTVSKQKSPGRTAAAVMRHPGYFPGVAHGCIIASNRNHYGAVAWTEDGLFAGFFLDRHKNDLPDWAYEPAGRGLSGMFAGDDWECAGSVAELADGSVLWIPRASGRAAVFRVRGWENWFRASGKIELKQTPPAAVPDGAGLAATYFRSKDFAGPPVVSRVDARLWFTSGDGDKRVASWAAGPCEGVAAAEPFSVRWTGRIVAPFSEDFWFRIYNQTTDSSFIQAQWWKAGAGSARVWLNDVLIADDTRFESAPVRLIAGHSYDVKIEYASPGITKPEFALSWASNTKEWKRVPTTNLHADAAPVGPIVRVTAEKASAIFTLAAKQPKPLTVRFRQTGTDAVTTAAQVTIPAAALTASAAVSVENGPRKIELEPSADYRGDGTAGAVTIGSVLSVPDGLAAAYLLDEAAGRTIHDSIGSAHAAFEDFMNPPVPRWQPTGGIRGGAMEFAEPGLRVNLPGAKIAGDFTVAFWLRTKQRTQPVMVGTFDLTLKDGHPQINFGGWPMAAPPDTARLDDGQWHHVAFVWNQSGGKRAMQIHLDAQLAATGPGPEKGSTDRLSLGVSNQLQGKPFIGSFDEIRIYQRALTTDEVAALAQRNAR